MDLSEKECDNFFDLGINDVRFGDIVMMSQPWCLERC